MFSHSTNTASFFFILIAALIFSLALAGIAAAQTNTSLGTGASLTTPRASPTPALGLRLMCLLGLCSTLRLSAQVRSSMPTIRSAWETTAVTVIEGQVAFTGGSDKTKKENFQPVDGEAVLGKIRGFELSSWKFLGHDPSRFRHYGPMAQDFFAAFGHDGVGQIGSETTINSGDMAGILMIAVQALEKRTAELKHKEARIAVLESRLEALELRNNHSIQTTAEKSLGDNIVKADVVSK